MLLYNCGKTGNYYVITTSSNAYILKIVKIVMCQIDGAATSLVSDDTPKLAWWRQRKKTMTFFKQN